jgi:hypothetical protein
VEHHPRYCQEHVASMHGDSIRRWLTVRTLICRQGVP